MSGMSLLLDLFTAVNTGSIKVVDLTQTLNAETPIIQLPAEFEQSNPFSKTEISCYCEKGPAWYWNNISCGEHTGTHFDAPIHWITGKDLTLATTDQIEPNRFIAPASVIDLTTEVKENEDYLLSINRVEEWENIHGVITPGNWVLLRTDWSKRTGADFLNFKDDGAHTPGLEADCVKWLAEERNVCGVGVETVGTDAGQGHAQEPPFPCHSFMHGTNRFGLASLTNLDQLPPIGALIFAAPLKIENGSGSPLRVLALAPAKDT